MLSVLQWFIGLGSTVFLPIIIFILGIIFGVKPAKAAISGFTVGIGSIGLNLVIGLLSDNLGTAIQVMGEHYGFSLNIMDIGCGVGGPLAFSTTLGIILIPMSLIVNLLFVMLGWTKNFKCRYLELLVSMFPWISCTGSYRKFCYRNFRSTSCSYASVVISRHFPEES